MVTKRKCVKSRHTLLLYSLITLKPRLQCYQLFISTINILTVLRIIYRRLAHWERVHCLLSTCLSNISDYLWFNRQKNNGSGTAKIRSCPDERPIVSCIELSTRSTVGYNINVKSSSSGRGRISVHIILYIVWGKGRHIDGFYAQGFECKKFHSKSSFFVSSLY